MLQVSGNTLQQVKFKYLGVVQCDTGAYRGLMAHGAKHKFGAPCSNLRCFKRKVDYCIEEKCGTFL